MKKKIFITGLHNKPQGCRASVASAVGGPFATKTSVRVYFMTAVEKSDTLGGDIALAADNKTDSRSLLHTVRPHIPSDNSHAPTKFIAMLARSPFWSSF
jgi:hypothetical protein